jgi:hypothetical protein
MSGQGKAMLALGRLKVGQMNKTEAAYAERLRQLQAAGEIQWHKFEGIKLRLADSMFYTPDFAVLAADGVMELMAAALYPMRFIAVRVKPKRDGGGWAVEEF